MSPLARPVQDLNWLITNFVERVPSVAHSIVVSADGKTRTVITSGTDAEGKKVKNKAIYDKQ